MVVVALKDVSAMRLPVALMLASVIASGLVALNPPTALAAPPAPALDHYAKALQAEREQRWLDAEYELQQAAALAPTDYLIWAKLGHVLTQLNQPQKALAATQRAAANNAHDASLYTSLASLYEQQGDLPAARQAYEQALRKFPDYRYALFPLGRVLARQGEVDKAIAVYGQFLTAYPMHHQAKRYLAGLYLGKQRPREALALLHDLQAKQGEGFSDYLMMADAYNALKQPQQALVVLEQARQKGQTMAVLSEVAAEARQAMGDLPAAIAELEDAVRKSPDKWDTHLRLAYLYQQSGQPNKAIIQVEPYIKSNPNDLSAKLLLATALLDAKAYQQASGVYQQVRMAAQPNTFKPDEWATLNKQQAFAWQQAGEGAKAIPLYQALLAESTQSPDPDVVRNLALAFHQEGNMIEALPLYRQWLKLTLNDGAPDASQQLAELPEGVVADFAKALQAQATTAEQAQQWPQAAQLYAEMASLPKLAPSTQQAAWLAQANALFNANDKPAALAVYQQVLGKNAQQPMARYRVAQLRYEQGSLPAAQALTQLEALIQPTLTPLATDAAMLAYTIAQRNNDSKKGLALLKAAEGQGKQRADYWLARGDAAYDMALRPEALTAFEQAIKLAQGEASKQASYNKASLLLEMGKAQPAAEAFGQVIKNYPDLAVAYYGLAVAQERNAKPNQALEAYQNYLTLAPQGEYATVATARVAKLTASVAPPIVTPAPLAPPTTGESVSSTPLRIDPF
jgi:tetratricopeptide (TPR) repeat protein